MSGYYYNMSRGRWDPYDYEDREEDDKKYMDYLTGGGLNESDIDTSSSDDDGEESDESSNSSDDDDEPPRGMGLYDEYNDEEY